MRERGSVRERERASVRGKKPLNAAPLVMYFISVCLCVREREKERERESVGEKGPPTAAPLALYSMAVASVCEGVCVCERERDSVRE